MAVSKDGILRFPRLNPWANSKLSRVEAKKLGLTRLERFEMRVATGHLPRGYDRLSRQQKKLAKYIARGVAIEDSCRMCKCTREVFYRWRRAHPLFREYLAKVSLRYAQHVDEQLEGQLPRAVQVVENAMQSGDPYFEYEASKDLLKGRGKYKSSVQSQQTVTGGLNIIGKTIHTHGMDKEMLMMFVNALVGKAQEVKRVETIDVKALPEFTEDAVETEVGDE